MKIGKHIGRRGMKVYWRQRGDRSLQGPTPSPAPQHSAARSNSQSGPCAALAFPMHFIPSLSLSLSLPLILSLYLSLSDSLSIYLSLSDSLYLSSPYCWVSCYALALFLLSLSLSLYLIWLFFNITPSVLLPSGSVKLHSFILLLSPPPPPPARLCLVLCIRKPKALNLHPLKKKSLLAWVKASASVPCREPERASAFLGVFQISALEAPNFSSQFGNGGAISFPKTLTLLFHSNGKREKQGKKKKSTHPEDRQSRKKEWAICIHYLLGCLSCSSPQKTFGWRFKEI